jgi:hypothetical protein
MRLTARSWAIVVLGSSVMAVRIVPPKFKPWRAKRNVIIFT